MDEEAVNQSVDTEIASPANEPITPDYNDLNYDETQEVVTPEVDEEPEVTEPVEAGEPEIDEPSTDEKSPRFEKRIRQLSAKVKELTTQAPVAPNVPIVPPVLQPNSVPQVRPRELPEGDYTSEEVNAFVQSEAVRTGQALSSIEVGQLRAELAHKDEVQAVTTAFTNDLHSIETRYPELNEDSKVFDAELSQTVTELYEDALLANPKTASLSKIAERVMKINERAATKSASAAVKSVTSQRSNSAPTSTTSGPSKSVSKWTPEAVEALSEDEYAIHEAAIKRDLLG